MSAAAAVLIEIGSEEIPSRMVSAAAVELESRVVGCLEAAGLAHGAARSFGGPRRLAVRVEDVDPRQADRRETVLGPPAEVAFGSDGLPTRAGEGFARKQGVDPSTLSRIETPKGVYAGFERNVLGKTVGEILAAELPARVESMPFAKSMRWGDGTHRWVRPVHWMVALHGATPIPIELFGVRAGSASRGHRFLSPGAARVEHPDSYVSALASAHVIVDPEARRLRLREALERAALECGGTCVPDETLLEEVANLLEWPGVVTGAFDPAFLDLPRELLTTTLRHHQKCFSVEAPEGGLRAAFLAVANTDRDPGGHVRRGNEWVVVGRLEDARFFWDEDRKRPLADLSAKLGGVTFHARAGTFGDKAQRMESLAGQLGARLELGEPGTGNCRRAARLAKNDLVTHTVGEFPELQGQVGGLLLESEGMDAPVARAVYHHYRPIGAQDELPPSVEGCVVSVADKLDTLAELVRVGERPKGSRDPYGLRRAAAGVFRILIDRGWPLSLLDLVELSGSGDTGLSDVLDKLFSNFLRDVGFTNNEVQAVLRPRVGDRASSAGPLHDVMSRLSALQRVRSREDFERLVDLTKRVDNILSKESDATRAVLECGRGGEEYREDHPAALSLQTMTDALGARLEESAAVRDYEAVIDLLAASVAPVDRFFAEVLVLDPDNLPATRFRRDLLARLREVLTRYFDIRELAGQAERRLT